MTLNLPEREMQEVERLCARYDMNKTSVIRKAIRMMVMIDKRMEESEKSLNPLKIGKNTPLAIPVSDEELVMA